MVFQVQILGVGDYFTQIHNFSSFVIHADGQFTLVDCPDGLRKILHEANSVSDIGVRLERIDHIILTHLHGDHANGLEGLAFFKKFCQSGLKPKLYSIREVFKDLWPQKLKAAMKQLYEGPSKEIRLLSAKQFQKACERVDFEDYFIPVTLGFDKINEVNNLRVEIHPVKHHLPTFGLKATYGGKSFGYSSDTFFDPSLIEFLKDCDMIIHECDIQRVRPHQGIHTDYNELVKLPAAIKEKLFLIHYPDTARQQDLDLKLLQEGYVYDIE